ncbi:MAG: hypothetical protein COW29_09575 [Rhodobacterales bacterium CG15_BIG_FIL_POST_REV_8_21_14_020_59_13]|nr:MAG: hypothetical protein COW29_09575 [Rhodobacterales bacterium CG15_BIG_FIL_POST_REV_8_21_14_020_59_13]
MRYYLAFFPVLALAACGAPENPPADPPPSSPQSGMAAMENTVSVAGQQTAIDVRAAWMRPHPAGRDVTAAYIVVALTEGAEDLLQAVQIEGADRVELHGHFMTEDGVMQMREIGPQRVGDDGPLVFTPGGRHLMVFGLPAVTEGATVSGTLIFQNAGVVPVSFDVRSMPPGLPADY